MALKGFGKVGSTAPPTTGTVDVDYRVDQLESEVDSVLVDGTLTSPLQAALDGRFVLSEVSDPLASVLGQAASGIDVLFVGDSITEGQGSPVSSTLSGRWIQRVVDDLRVRTGTTGGRGYVPAYYDLNVAYDSAAPTQGGDVTESITKGLGRRAATLGSTGTAGSLTLSVTGTAVDVVYRKETGAGSFTIDVDGTTVATVDCAAAPYTYGGYKERVTFSARGTHELVVTHSAGGDVDVEGFFIFDGDESSGVRLWDGAKSGYTADSFAANQTWQQSLQAVAPDLVFIALGTNDFRTNISAANYGVDVGNIVDRIRAQTVPGGASIIAEDVPIVLVHLQEPNDAVYTPSWADYLAQLNTIAAARSGVYVLDLSKNIAAGTNLDGDGIHPNASGHLMIAGTVAAAIPGRFAAAKAPTVDRAGSHGPPIFAYTATAGTWNLAGTALNSDGVQNTSITYTFPTQAGTFTFRLLHIRSTNRGIYTVTIDGVSVGTIDGYNASTGNALSEISGISLDAGLHTVTLTMATKNASSGFYYGSICALALAQTA